VVPKLLGHNQRAMTLRYAHAAERDIEAATERLGARIARLLECGGCDGCTKKAMGEAVPLSLEYNVSQRKKNRSSGKKTGSGASLATISAILRQRPPFFSGVEHYGDGRGQGTQALHLSRHENGRHYALSRAPWMVSTDGV